MPAKEIFQALRDGFGVRRVYGDPVERDGVTMVPAAHVIGGGGGGTAPEGGGSEGVGFGGVAWPAGAFEIRESGVTWKPATDYRGILALLALVLVLVMIGLRHRD